MNNKVNTPTGEPDHTPQPGADNVEPVTLTEVVKDGAETSESQPEMIPGASTAQISQTAESTEHTEGEEPVLSEIEGLPRPNEIVNKVIQRNSVRETIEQDNEPELDIEITIEDPIDEPDFTSEVIENEQPATPETNEPQVPATTVDKENPTPVLNLKDLKKKLRDHIKSMAGVISDYQMLEEGISAIILIDKQLFANAEGLTFEELEEKIGKVEDGKRLVLITKEGEFLVFGGAHSDKIDSDTVENSFSWLAGKTVNDFKHQSAYTENAIYQQGNKKNSLNLPS